MLIITLDRFKSSSSADPQFPIKDKTNKAKKQDKFSIVENSNVEEKMFTIIKAICK